MVWEKLIAWLSFAAVLAALAVSGGGRRKQEDACGGRAAVCSGGRC